MHASSRVPVSMDETMFIRSEHLPIFARPMPAPKPSALIFSDAVVYPGRRAFSTSGIPGPRSSAIIRAWSRLTVTVMLPPKTADGARVKGPLESAFLTKAMPLGLDTIIGSVKRKYELLEADHPAMICLEDVLQADGFEAIMRVREFYA